jgi:hypothetical protein
VQWIAAFQIVKLHPGSAIDNQRQEYVMTTPMDDTPLPSFAGSLLSWSDAPPYGAQQPRRQDTQRAMMKHLSEELSTRRYLEAPLAATASAIAEPLSVRQRDILDLIAQGRSNKEIARVLSIAPETVKTTSSTSSLSSTSGSEHRPFRARTISDSLRSTTANLPRPCNHLDRQSPLNEWRLMAGPERPSAVARFELANLPAISSHSASDAPPIPHSEDGVSGEPLAHFASDEFSRRETDVEACVPFLSKWPTLANPFS